MAAYGASLRLPNVLQNLFYPESELDHGNHVRLPVSGNFYGAQNQQPKSTRSKVRIVQRLACMPETAVSLF